MTDSISKLLAEWGTGHAPAKRRGDVARRERGHDFGPSQVRVDSEGLQLFLTMGRLW